MTNLEGFNALLRGFVASMQSGDQDADVHAFSDADPDTWLSPKAESQSQNRPFCFEHEPVTDENGVTTCGRCGASEDELVAEREAQLEADIALGVYPDLDTGIDEGPDSERSEFGPNAWLEDDGEDF